MINLGKARHYFRMGEKKYVEFSTRKPIGMRPVRIHRRRRENDDNIKIGLKETGWVIVGFFYPVQSMENRRAFVNTVMNLFVS
jgi:hypothetical protein